MNTTLSFRKETIQRSSNANEPMHQAQSAQGTRGAREQRPISIGTLFTLTQ